MCTQLQSTTETNSKIKDVCYNVRKNLSPEDWEDFSEQRNDSGRIQSLIKNPEVLDTIEKFITNVDNGEGLKNLEKAILLKDSGNKFFGQGNNDKALQCYSDGLTWIPADEESSRDMAIIHANRSAALFHLQDYRLALQDIDIAFSLNYPKNLHYKLYERATRCYLQENKMAEASSQIQKGLKSLTQLLANCSNAEEAKKLVKAKDSLESLQKSCSNSTQVSNNPGEQKKIIPSISPGKFFKNASVKLTIQDNEREGRFVVANQDINPGEVILVEKANVSALASTQYHQHCIHCYTPLRAPIPCLECSTISYCSLKCRDEGKKIHKYECQILGILHRSGVSIICLMALKILTQNQGKEKIQDWFDMVEKTETGGKSVPSQDTKESQYRSQDFSTLCDLVTHSDRREAPDFFQRSVIALFILSLLNRTPFLKKTKEEPKDTKMQNSGIVREDIMVGTIILRMLQVLQFNAHEISGWDERYSKSNFLGGGLYPTLALFNHSCNPGIIRYFINDMVIVRAVRTIQKGEQVTENYGVVFTEIPKTERQVQLESQYWFECACIACQEDWPLFESLNRDDLTFRCTNCRTPLCKVSSMSMGLLLRCSKCGRPTNILKSLKSLQDSEPKYHQAIELMNKGRPESAVGILEENLSLFDSILMPPFRDYHWCQEGLRKCYLAQGNESHPRIDESNKEEPN